MSASAPIQADSAVSSIRVEQSVLARAKANDTQAIALMFQQFLSPDEEIYFAEYCGVQGFWGLGRHCFACLTNRRLAALTVGLFGLINYQDGYLEHGNSGVIYQPSKLALYFFAVLAAIFAIVVLLSTLTSGVGIIGSVGGLLGVLGAVLAVALGLVVSALVFLLVVKMYYRLFKCGLLLWIREGVSVYVFTNRSKLSRANHLYRLCAQVRDQRLKTVSLA